MRKLSKVFAGLLVSVCVSQSYAIEVNMHATSDKIDGLGFSVNGEKHGGPGSNYQASDMPKGTYSFGLRADGKDVACYSHGKKTVKLDRNTNEAILDFNGKHCSLKLSSR